MFSIHDTYQFGLIGNYPKMNKTSGNQERKTAGILSKNKIFENSTTQWLDTHFIKADRSPNLYIFIHMTAIQVSHSDLCKASNRPSVPAISCLIIPSIKRVLKINSFAGGSILHYSLSTQDYCGGERIK